MTALWLEQLRAGTLDAWGLAGLWNNQHPVGTQVAASWVVTALFGFHFKTLVYLSVALILATAVLARRVAGPATDVWSEAGLCLFFLLLSFHPNQMEHLLWAFELGWFMVNGCVVGNVLLVERLGNRALAPVALVCVVATLSSAQGAFAWFAAALHLALRGDGVRRWSAVAALAACGSLAVARVVAHAETIVEGTRTIPGDLAGLPVFALQIVGTAFAIRNHTLLLLAGLALAGLVLALGFRLAGRGGDHTVLRGGSVLAAFSILCVVGFARGRLGYGLDWALGSFHAAPLLVPFSLGAVLLLAEARRAFADGERLGAMLAVPLAILLAAGWGVSWNYGAKRARLWTMDRGYAVWAACHREVPYATVVKAAGAEGFADPFATVLPRLTTLCTDDLGALAATLTAQPPLFRRLATERPEARGALDVVWQDYATELLLQLAFDPRRPDTPARLLALAKTEAKEGPPFDHGRWQAFGPILLTLP